MVDICREQLDAWAAAGQMDLSTQAKDLSFEFSTRLLVKFKVGSATQWVCGCVGVCGGGQGGGHMYSTCGTLHGLA